MVLQTVNLLNRAKNNTSIFMCIVYVNEFSIWRVREKQKRIEVSAIESLYLRLKQTMMRASNSWSSAMPIHLYIIIYPRHNSFDLNLNNKNELLAVSTVLSIQTMCTRFAWIKIKKIKNMKLKKTSINSRFPEVIEELIFIDSNQSRTIQIKPEVINRWSNNLKNMIWYMMTVTKTIPRSLIHTYILRHRIWIATAQFMIGRLGRKHVYCKQCKFILWRFANLPTAHYLYFCKSVCWNIDYA